MYCKFCGKEIDEQSKYCSHCGKQVDGILSKIRLTDKQKGIFLLFTLYFAFHLFLLIASKPKPEGFIGLWPFNLYRFQYYSDYIGRNVYEIGSIYFYDSVDFIFYIFLIPLTIYTIYFFIKKLFKK